MTGGSFRERLRRRAARWGLIAAMGLCGVAGIVPPVGERARAAEVRWRRPAWCIVWIKIHLA